MSSVEGDLYPENANFVWALSNLCVADVSDTCSKI
jgi:hypothetical protein